MLSALDVAIFLAVGVIAVIYGYVAFSALAIRRTLSEQLYRRQALGLALLILLLALAATLSLLITPLLGQPLTSSLFPIYVLVLFENYAVVVGGFYWVDASIGAARITDPLLRDTLRWRSLRIAFWIVVIIIGFLGNLAYLQFLVAAQLFLLPPWPISLLFEAPYLVLFFAAVVPLPIASRRSGDKALRKHLEWFAVAAVVLVVQQAIRAILFAFYPDIITGAANIGTWLVVAGAGYFLYRSTKSLVSLYRFSGGEND